MLELIKEISDDKKLIIQEINDMCIEIEHISNKTLQISFIKSTILLLYGYFEGFIVDSIYLVLHRVCKELSGINYNKNSLHKVHEIYKEIFCYQQLY